MYEHINYTRVYICLYIYLYIFLCEQFFTGIFIWQTICLLG